MPLSPPPSPKAAALPGAPRGLGGGGDSLLPSLWSPRGLLSPLSIHSTDFKGEPATGRRPPRRARCDLLAPQAQVWAEAIPSSALRHNLVSPAQPPGDLPLSYSCGTNHGSGRLAHGRAGPAIPSRRLASPLRPKGDFPEKGCFPRLQMHFVKTEHFLSGLHT